MTEVQTASAKKGDFFYASFDEQGNLVNRRPITRGRPPLGYDRCQSLPDGTIVRVQKEAPVQLNASDTTGHCVIQSNATQKIDDILRYIKPQKKTVNNNIMTLVMCDIVGEPVISYFKGKHLISRIDLMQQTHEIQVWEHEYKAGKPDVVIKNAIV
mgnify:CR=1 FL=1